MKKKTKTKPKTKIKKKIGIPKTIKTIKSITIPIAKKIIFIWEKIYLKIKCN